MTEFQAMVQDIIKYGKAKVDRSVVAEHRLMYINDMRKELVAMKEMWEILHPSEDTTVPTFEQIVKQLA